MRTVCLAILLWTMTVPLTAQWLQLPLPRTPRTAEGQPNLAAPVPRTGDGRPDLSGIWLAWNWHPANPDRGKFTRPWSATARFQLLPDTEVLEYICENQRWAPPQ